MVTPEPWDGADGQALRAAQRDELDARYGCDDHEPGAPPTAKDVTVFLVARDEDGQACGCGGLRLLGENTAEIKRMYVTPERRGTGVAVAVLQSLETAAAERGIVTLLLETGTSQPEAMRFYEREGYQRIEKYGPYVDSEISACYRRDLPAAHQPERSSTNQTPTAGSVPSLR